MLDKNVYDSSTRKYCDKIEFALACLKSSIDSNNLVNIVKYMNEVESYDLSKMEAKSNEYKTKSADAQSVYESNKAKYDAVYSVLKFDSEYNEWGKNFYSSNNKYSEGLAKLKSALEKDNIPNLAKCRDEVAAFDFTEMEKKVEDYKTKSSDAQKNYDTQKAKYDAVYSVLKLDSDYTGSGKIFYSSSNKYSEGLARLKSALGKDNIPNLAKCRDEVAAFDFTELETKVAEYKTIADSAQSVYENYKSRYDAIYSILKDDINYKSLLDKNNYDYSAGVYYNKIELALNGFKTAIDSKNIVKIAKQKKEVDAIDFDGMEIKTVEYKTKSSDAQSVYNSQKLKYDMIYEILKNDKKYTSQGGVFSSPDNVYSKTLSNLKTALDNKNFVEIAKYRDEVASLDFSELSGEFDAYIEKLENALSVYESQKAIYDLVYDVLKDDKAYGGKKKIFSSSYNTYSRKLELLKKSIDEKNFYEIEKWQSDVARFDFTELIEAAQNYIDKADVAMYKQNFDVWNVRKTAECKDVLNILHYNELCKIYNVVESRRLLKEKLAEFGYIGNYENAETESNATFVVTEIVPDSNADGQSIKPNNILVFDDVESAYKSFSAMKKKGNKVTVLAYTKEKQKKSSKVTIKMKK